MKKVLIVGFLGLSILLGCQENEKTILESKNNELSEPVTKTTVPHFDTIIAHMINFEIIFADNIGNKISIWEDIINNSTSLSIDFNEYSIEQEEGEYYLEGSDASICATARIKLVLEAGIFYEREYPAGNPLKTSTGLTVTCSGCTSTGPGLAGECQPKENEDGWYCTDCSQGTCTKSTSVITGGVISGSAI